MNAPQHGDPNQPDVKKALFAGIFANLGVALAKFVAFSFTRSSAMLAEAVHSVADSSNQALLLVGLWRSGKQPSRLHPFGYSKERYFWGFVVAVNIFLLGAVFAIYEGVQKMIHPHPMQNMAWNYAALVLAMLFEASALRVAWREFQHWREEHPGSLFRQLRAAKDLTLPTVIFEDTAALMGLLIAGVGITLAHFTGLHWIDGLASVLIGLILLAVAWFLAVESHSLLLGEAASEEDQSRIRQVLGGFPEIDRVVSLATLQRGPDQILIALEIEFHEGLDTGGIEDAICRIEEGIQAVVPDAQRIYVEAKAFRRGPRG